MKNVKSILLLFFCNIIFVSCNKNSDVEKNFNSKSNYELGLDEFNKGYYYAADLYFREVLPTDSNYEDAQEKLKITALTVKKWNDAAEIRVKAKEDEYKKISEDYKKREVVKKKYEKIIGGRGWLHEKKSKLADMGFIQYNSGYENTPGGSKELAYYYKKRDGDYIVHVKLQYHYSIDRHYVDVWVTD
jgi:hypothetical protein